LGFFDPMTGSRFASWRSVTAIAGSDRDLPDHSSGDSSRAVASPSRWPDGSASARFDVAAGVAQIDLETLGQARGESGIVDHRHRLEIQRQAAVVEVGAADSPRSDRPPPATWRAASAGRTRECGRRRWPVRRNSCARRR
jgi:hypothetical protein